MTQCATLLGWIPRRAFTAEVEALRMILRQVQKSPGHWAALSFPATSQRWQNEQRGVLWRAGLSERHERDTNEAVSDG